MIKNLCLMSALFLFSFSVPAENITNNHPSPYVRLHANDAVKWQRWDKSILQRAKKENKLIFISSGYYACHWCHVMRKESFTDKAVAKILNENYIPVKIDRELKPSLDAYLMGFVQAAQGFGGWPLNVFLTPEGYPLTGLVYLPKNDFISVINKLNSKWLNENVRLKNIALSVFDHSRKINKKTEIMSNKDLLDMFFKSVDRVSDDLEGGFGDASKFPMPYLMMSLISVYEKDNNEELAEFINLTLKQMTEQGLHDSIGGGFFRYTVDQGWQTPHFEKMLYTNAAMISLYVKAYEVFENKKWLFVAEETMNFVIREMKKQDGGYVSSLNAQDVNSQEGGNYLWKKQALIKLLNKSQQSWFEKNVRYSQQSEGVDVLPLGLWQGKKALEVKKLLMKKRSNNRPVKDNKMLISWNAYLLSSMIELIEITENKRYIAAAEELYDDLNKQVESGLARNQKIYPQKYLDDYVFTANAFWLWSKYKKEKANKQQLEELINDINALFVSSHGWKETDQTIIPFPGDLKNIKDGNLPSTEVVYLNLLQQMRIEGEELKARNMIDIDVRVIDIRVKEQPLEYSSLIIFKTQSLLNQPALPTPAK